MSDALTLYDLAHSPNSVKVRLALAALGLSYRRVAVEGRDRAEVLRVSGQPLTPVLTHGDRVIYDSAAILRYLDANLGHGPRLFSSDYDEMKEIERWERIGRYELNECTGMVIRAFRGIGGTGAEVGPRASRMLHERTAQLEEALAGRDWLVGGRTTAADLTCATAPWYGTLEKGKAPFGKVGEFFAEHLHLGEGRERTRAWASRVMELDRAPSLA